MAGVVKGFDYSNVEAMRYWSFPSSYSKEKKQEQFNLILYSGDYIASEKTDGYWALFIKDDEGNFLMRSRSKGVNGWIFKQDWIPHLHPFFNQLPNGTVLIGELYLPGKTSRAVTSILGCGVEKAIDRQKGSNRLQLSIFDILAHNGLQLHTLPIIDRIEFLNSIKPIAEKTSDVKVVEYWSDPEEIRENWLNIISSGGEGVMLTKKDYPYQFGKRTARATLKLKKELEETIDVFFTGNWKEAKKEYEGTELETWKYWYDESKEERIEGALYNSIHLNAITPVTRLWFYEMAGALEIATLMNGKITPIGYISGVADEVREGIVRNNEEWKYRVVELQAMEISYNNGIPALRHAKIINWRTDKHFSECIWNH